MSCEITGCVHAGEFEDWYRRMVAGECGKEASELDLLEVNRKRRLPEDGYIIANHWGIDEGKESFQLGFEFALNVLRDCASFSGRSTESDLS